METGCRTILSSFTASIRRRRMPKSGDWDGDGMTNQQELGAGTDPKTLEVPFD